MKLSNLLFIAFLAFMATSCSDDDDNMEMEMAPDTTGPMFNDHRWIDSPFYENQPTGDIVPGGMYEISIASGFQYLANVSDESNMTIALGYITVNNDPDILEYMFFPPGAQLGYKEGTFGFVHRAPTFSLGGGVFYELQPGYELQFYLSFTDEFENETVVEWSARLVE